MVYHQNQKTNIQLGDGAVVQSTVPFSSTESQENSVIASGGIESDIFVMMSVILSVVVCCLLLIIAGLLLSRSSKSRGTPVACEASLSQFVSESQGHDLHFENKDNNVLKVAQEGNDVPSDEQEGNENDEENLYDTPETTMGATQTAQPGFDDI